MSGREYDLDLKLPCFAPGDEGGLDVGRHELGNILAVVGCLPHDGGGKVAPLDGRCQEDRFDAGRHGEVGVGQLDLVFKVGDRAQTAHHDGGVFLLGEADSQTVEGIHFYVGDVLAAFPQHGNALLDRKQGLFGTVDQHRNDDLVEHTAGALDNIQMPAGDGIKTAGIHGNGHIGLNLSETAVRLLKNKHLPAEI